MGAFKYRTEVELDGPWATYRLDEASGATQFNDSSGNARHATGGANATERVAGQFGNGLNIPATNHYKARPTQNALVGPWSVEFFGKPIGTTPLYGSSQYALTSGGSRWVMPPQGDISVATGIAIGTNGVCLGEHTANHAPGFSWAGTLPTDSFTHFVWTYSGNGPFLLYVNKVLVMTTVNRTTSRYAPGYIGSTTLFGDLPGGQVDEVSFYATQLSATRIAAHYDAITIPDGDPLWTHLGSNSAMVMG